MDNIRYKINLLLGFSIMCLMVPISVVGSIWITLGVSGITRELLLATIHPAYFGAVLVGTILYFLAGRIIRSKKLAIVILAFGTILLSFFSLCWFFLSNDVSSLLHPAALAFLPLNPGIEELIIYTLMVLAIFWLAEWIFSINFRKVWLVNILIIVVFNPVSNIIQQLPNTSQLFLVLGLASSYIFMIAIIVTLLTFLTDVIFLLFWEFSSRG